MIPTNSNQFEVFEVFTASPRRAVVQAQEARKRRHACIGTEHLLLGLIAKNEDSLVQVLRRLGIETTAIRDKVAEMRPPGPVSAIGRIPFTPRALVRLLIAAVVPILPLVLTMIPAEELLQRLLKVVF